MDFIDVKAIAMMMKPTTIATAALLTFLSFATDARAENLEHIKQLLSTKQCPKCELSNAGLVLGNFAGANLSGASLIQANLSRANLSAADLTQADLRSASLFGANLAGANLSGANLAGADLREAYLAGANLTGVNLAGANLKGAIGVVAYTEQFDDLYKWAMDEGQRGNYPGAIAYFNQALAMKPEFAPGYLGRGAARAEMGDYSGAVRDGTLAGQLFTAQNNPTGAQASEGLVKNVQAIEKRVREGGKGGGGSFIQMLGGLLMQFLF